MDNRELMAMFEWEYGCDFVPTKGYCVAMALAAVAVMVIASLA